MLTLLIAEINSEAHQSELSLFLYSFTLRLCHRGDKAVLADSTHAAAAYRSRIIATVELAI